MRTSSPSPAFHNFRIHYHGDTDEALFSFSYRDGRVTVRCANPDDNWWIDRHSSAAPSADVAWRAVVELLKDHNTPYIYEFSDLNDEITIKGWDNWRAQAIAVALLHDQWDGEHVYADMFLSFSDEQLEQVWTDYDHSLLDDFVDSLRALRFLELDDFATFRTENLGGVFAEHGYPSGDVAAKMTAENVFDSLHEEVEQRKRESVGVVDRAPAKRPGYQGPFRDFEVAISAFFKQPWDVRYAVSIDGDGVLRFEFTTKGTLEWSERSYRQLHGSSAWRAALRIAASLDIGLLCPHHLRSFELSGWNDWRAQLFVVALLRDKFRMESRYGRGLLSLTSRQAVKLHEEFGSFIERPYRFIEFLKEFRAVDAAPGYDRNDLRGFLDRYGYGTAGVTTSDILARAGKEHEDALSARPAPPGAPPRRGGLIDRGYALPEELGLNGVTLVSIGGRTGGVA